MIRLDQLVPYWREHADLLQNGIYTREQMAAVINKMAEQLERALAAQPAEPTAGVLGHRAEYSCGCFANAVAPERLWPYCPIHGEQRVAAEQRETP